MNNKSIAILVSSCDWYADIWEYFFYFWDLFAQGCKYKIYLVSNNVEYSKSYVNQIFVPTSDWSTEMKEVCNKIPEKYILYMQDDYFIKKEIDFSRIWEILDMVLLYDVSYVRLFPEPLDRIWVEFQEQEGFKKIQIWAPFITSLQVAIWNKDVFFELLEEWESIRDFEMNSPARTLKLNKPLFLEVEKKRPYPIEYICTAIRRWKRQDKSVKFCHSYWLDIDFKKRPIENWIDIFKKSIIYNNSPLWLKNFLHKFFW